MKPAFKSILTLAMALSMAASCVSSPPPASPPPASPEPVTETSAAAAAEADSSVTTASDASTAVADGTATEQTTSAAPLAESPAEQKPAAPQSAPEPAPQATPAPAPQAPPVAPDTSAPTAIPATPAPAPPATPAPTAPAAPSAPATPAPLATPRTPASPPSRATDAGPEKLRQIGEVVFTEGKVSVHRAGKSIMSLDIGDVVYAYDVVMTGPASLAQVDLGAGRPGGAFIRLSENTAFYFDSKELSAEQRRTVLQLLSGSIAVKVERLAGGSFSLASDTAVLGVRGTEFIVDTIPDGSILVSCVAGAVAIQGSEGQSAIAQPGKAVAGNEAGLVTTAVRVPELAQFRSGWRSDSFSDFAGQAVRYSSAYAATLDDNRRDFDTALANLQSQDAILQLWREARAAGRVPRFTDWIPEKKTLGGVLFDSLKSLFLLERPYYRLLELRTLHESGTGVGTLQDGRNTSEFFDLFETRYGSLANGMAVVREALLLFAWASAGSPLGEFFGAKAENLGSGALLLDGDDW